MYTQRRCYVCNQIGHIARFCPTKSRRSRQWTPSDQPSGYKSTKRLQRDRDRMGAFNAHKALMANLPFADVNNDELVDFFPKLVYEYQFKVFQAEEDMEFDKLIDKNDELESHINELAAKYNKQSDEVKHLLEVNGDHTSKMQNLRQRFETVKKENTKHRNEIDDLKAKLLQSDKELNEHKKSAEHVKLQYVPPTLQPAGKINQKSPAMAAIWRGHPHDKIKHSQDIATQGIGMARRGGYTGGTNSQPQRMMARRGRYTDGTSSRPQNHF